MPWWAILMFAVALVGSLALGLWVVSAPGDLGTDFKPRRRP